MRGVDPPVAPLSPRRTRIGRWVGVGGFINKGKLVGRGGGGGGSTCGSAFTA